MKTLKFEIYVFVGLIYNLLIAPAQFTQFRENTAFALMPKQVREIAVGLELSKNKNKTKTKNRITFHNRI